MRVSCLSFQSPLYIVYGNNFVHHQTKMPALLARAQRLLTENTPPNGRACAGGEEEYELLVTCETEAVIA